MDYNTLIESMSFDSFYDGVFSDPKKGDYKKIGFKTVLINGERFIQFSLFKNNQVFHENMDLEEARIFLKDQRNFKQLLFRDIENDYHIFFNDDKIRIKKKQSIKSLPDGNHNRIKEYILPEGEKVDFLIELGVMTAEGRVVKKYFHKFKQINKFLEFIDNEVKDFNKEKINCLDFGCGKSYLTFAMYYYFRKKGFKEIKIVGLDLKQDVVQKMNELAKKLNYTGLEFLPKDIREYSIGEEVDLLVTLHACDTLTDIALKNAAEKKIKTILSVPCCQHELFDQLENRDFNPILEYGI